MNWDFDGRGDSLNYFEQNAIKQILNEEKDFETADSLDRTPLWKAANKGFIIQYFRFLLFL